MSPLRTELPGADQCFDTEQADVLVPCKHFLWANLYLDIAKQVQQARMSDAADELTLPSFVA